MEQYIIKGGNPLVGEVVIGGAKNAALPVLAAAVMTDGKCMIDNMPDVRDINVLLQAMQEIGADVDRTGKHEDNGLRSQTRGKSEDNRNRIICEQ